MTSFKHQSLLSSQAEQTHAVDVTVHDLSHDGRGVARLNGKVLFIAGALPDEKVRVRLVKQKSQYAEGTLLEILTASPLRRQPVCRHAGICGGCQLQHLDYDEQISTKQKSLISAFAHKKIALPEVLDAPLYAAPFAYRRRAKWVVNRDHQLCFHSQGGQSKVAIDHCHIVTDAMNLVLQSLQRDIAQRVLPVHSLLAVELWDLDGCYIQLTVDAKWRAQQSIAWQSWVQSAGLSGVSFIAEHQRTYTPDVFPMTPNTMSYLLNDLRLRVRDDQFIQANPQVNALMVTQACEWLSPNKEDVVVDLFCGVGNFTLPLAQYVDRILGLELNEQSVISAQENAMYNNIGNARFAIANLFDKDWHLPKDTTLLLLDPPWDGALAVCEKIKKNKHLKKILYISCHPASMVRDVEILQSGGFNVVRAGLIDQFPQTYHIESMVLLTR